MKKPITAVVSLILAMAPLTAAYAQQDMHRSMVRNLNVQNDTSSHRLHVMPGREYSAPTGGNPYTHQFPSTDGSGR
jgi:hypothetical protein